MLPDFYIITFIKSINKYSLMTCVIFSKEFINYDKDR